MEQQLNQKLRIEFASSGKELDCKVLQYKNYIKGSDEYYEDYNEFKIARSENMGKTYIDITQANNEEGKFDSVIVSIFSTNGEHIAGDELTKLSYVIRYTTYSDYGIYNFKDLNESEGDIELIREELYDLNMSNITAIYQPIKYQKNDGEYIKEQTRFYMKLFPISKKAQKLYETISLFESMLPLSYVEEYNTNQFNFQVDPSINYFMTTNTVSNAINEILSYKTIKIRRNRTNMVINDDNIFENDYEGEIINELDIGVNITKKYLQIKISEYLNQSSLRII